MKTFKLSLRIRIILCVVLLTVVALSSIICVNIFYQQKEMTQQSQTSAKVLADAVYNAILYPMSTGDSETIRQQMAAFEKDGNNVKVHVFGFDKLITYTSESGKENSLLSEKIKSQSLNQGLGDLLATGKAPESAFHDEQGGIHYLSLLLPLLNEERCHHCHGSSRSVLGGLLVEQNSNSMLTTIQTMRNKNIFIGLLGSLAVALLLILMVSRLVDRPIRR